MSKTILLVDDEVEILSSLKRCLRGVDANILLASSPVAALECAKKNKIDVVISDQRMPSMSGTELLTHINVIHPQCSKLIVSAHADFNDITTAFNEKKIDHFFAKPWDNRALRFQVQQLLSGNQLAIDQEGMVEFHGIVTRDDAMKRVFSQIVKAARSDLPVFIFGETGTGKERTAQAIHAESFRSEQPFIPFNCANFNENLMESQLFGHKKGAFTGADRDQKGIFGETKGGILFLDEITSIPLNLQAKLLRVLQEKQYSPVGQFEMKSFDGQVVSASNMPLMDAVEQNVMREDLRYRLEVIPIILPALRDRKDDIELLFKLFLNRVNKQSWQLSDDTLMLLKAFPWPGNIRQLENVAMYAATMSEGDIIEVSMLPTELQQYHLTHSDTGNISNIRRDAKFKDISKEAVQALLANCKNNKSKVAEELGVSRMTLWRTMKELGME